MRSIISGFSHGYSSGDPLLLFDDLQVLKPTLFGAVPRILNRVYSKVIDEFNIAGGAKKWIFEKALETKKRNFLTNAKLTHSIYDILVFRKIKNIFGGNIRWILCGSAPIHDDVLLFFKVALQVNI